MNHGSFLLKHCEVTLSFLGKMNSPTYGGIRDRILSRFQKFNYSLVMSNFSGSFFILMSRVLYKNTIVLHDSFLLIGNPLKYWLCRKPMSVNWLKKEQISFIFKKRVFSIISSLREVEILKNEGKSTAKDQKSVSNSSRAFLKLVCVG